MHFSVGIFFTYLVFPQLFEILKKWWTIFLIVHMNQRKNSCKIKEFCVLQNVSWRKLIYTNLNWTWTVNLAKYNVVIILWWNTVKIVGYHGYCNLTSCGITIPNYKRREQKYRLKKRKIDYFCMPLFQNRISNHIRPILVDLYASSGTSPYSEARVSR